MKVVQALGTVVLMGLLAGCGGDSEPMTEPPPPAPPPEVEVVFDAEAEWVDCTNVGSQFDGCVFQGSGSNLGPDCAYGVNGLVRFFDESGAQIGAAKSWGADRSPVLPGRSFIFMTSSLVGDKIPISTVEATATYQLDPSWVAGAC